MSFRSVARNLSGVLSNRNNMPKVHEYYIYIMASINRVIYVGVTNNLKREHNNSLIYTLTKDSSPPKADRNDMYINFLLLKTEFYETNKGS